MWLDLWGSAISQSLKSTFCVRRDGDLAGREHRATITWQKSLIKMSTSRTKWMRWDTLCSRNRAWEPSDGDNDHGKYKSRGESTSGSRCSSLGDKGDKFAPLYIGGREESRYFQARDIQPQHLRFFSFKGGEILTGGTDGDFTGYITNVILSRCARSLDGIGADEIFGISCLQQPFAGVKQTIEKASTCFFFVFFESWWLLEVLWRVFWLLYDAYKLWITTLMDTLLISELCSNKHLAVAKSDLTMWNWMGFQKRRPSKKVIWGHLMSESPSCINVNPGINCKMTERCTELGEREGGEERWEIGNEREETWGGFDGSDVQSESFE